VKTIAGLREALAVKDRDLDYALDILANRPDRSFENIEKELDDEFFSRTGRHGCIGGRTRTGKTTLLYHLVDGILSFGKEHVASLDTGKSSEFLTYALFQPLRILVPAGVPTRKKKLDLSIEMNPNAAEILRKKYHWPEDGIEKFIKNFENSVVVPVDVKEGIWTECKRGEIAIISIKRFIPDPDLYASIIAHAFTKLIYDTWDHRVQLPMTVVADEAQRIAPSRKNNEGWEQHRAGKIIGANLEEMASMGIRFLFGTQGWGKLRPTVRDSFEWIFIKRGIRFTYETGRLYDFEPLWNKVPTTHCYIARPDGSFTDPYRVPLYPAGWELGTVRYNGRLDGTKTISRRK